MSRRFPLHITDTAEEENDEEDAVEGLKFMRISGAWLRWDPATIRSLAEVFPPHCSERAVWLQESARKEGEWRRRGNASLLCGAVVASVVVVALGRPSPQGPVLYDTCLGDNGNLEATRCSVAFFDEWSLTHISTGMLLFWIARLLDVVWRSLAEPRATIGVVLMLASAFETIENGASLRNARLLGANPRIGDYMRLHLGDTAINCAGDMACVLVGALWVQQTSKLLAFHATFLLSVAWCLASDTLLWLHLQDGAVALWLRLVVVGTLDWRHIEILGPGAWEIYPADRTGAAAAASIVILLLPLGLGTLSLLPEGAAILNGIIKPRHDESATCQASIALAGAAAAAVAVMAGQVVDGPKASFLFQCAQKGDLQPYFPAVVVVRSRHPHP